jgi:hypothetical protein
MCSPKRHLFDGRHCHPPSPTKTFVGLRTFWGCDRFNRLGLRFSPYFVKVAPAVFAGLDAVSCQRESSAEACDFQMPWVHINYTYDLAGKNDVPVKSTFRGEEESIRTISRKG